MKELTPYLTFDGQCEQAMKFYQSCLGGDLQIMPFSQGAGGMSVPPGSEHRVMHSTLKRGQATLMASDTMPGMPFQKGSNFSISIDCQNQKEVDTLFSSLSQGGRETMPPQQTFWGAYFAMLTDQFGVQWMFNFDMPQSHP